MLAVEVALLSEVGGRRCNEDACGHTHTVDTLCCVLADGAGGHGGGDTASQLAVQLLLQDFMAHPPASGTELEALLRATNQAVIDARVPGTATAQMHSTVVVLLLDFVGQRALWAHAGDSRLYWLRGGRIVARSRDHSVVQALVDAGLVDLSELREHPRRSELTSALGVVDEQMTVDVSGQAQPVQPGDVFLLCSDGLWEHVDDTQIEAALDAAATPQDWLSTLEQAVVAAGAKVTHQDNFTALAVWTRPAPVDARS